MKTYTRAEIARAYMERREFAPGEKHFVALSDHTIAVDALGDALEATIGALKCAIFPSDGAVSVPRGKCSCWPCEKARSAEAVLRAAGRLP